MTPRPKRLSRKRLKAILRSYDEQYARLYIRHHALRGRMLKELAMDEERPLPAPDTLRRRWDQ